MSGRSVANALALPRGVTCLVGGGGKTTLAHVLAAQLPGSVIFCTTTRIFPSETLPVVTGGPWQIAAALDRARAACVGTPAQQGKLAAPEASLEQLCLLADYVIVEADGSKGLPCKAHLEYEPVIPPETDRTILVVGASGFGQPIAQAAHRPERFAALCGASAEDIVTPERLAAVLNAEGGFDTVLVNQMEDSGREAAAGQLAALLPVPVWGGSLRAGQVRQL
ncbi:MAG TPA: putative selenium-dependent hydroxylase accessory protein YqeC [Candidatus Avoscillospira avistercoris]|uniref:Selenium-dependent hydroxylase accessory protein YqeC n=1 Tax=Candidatus Avoscillospira avistercoris TaxID=2840707 RepID=A0A9D1JTY8_9FIRM|nr:putative selenium-dependent hydroxylase accessory protein YqeC [Candidatus Avoscillospira avistercoris]